MKKRILYFLSTFNPYGSQIRASRFATCIASAFDVQAVCFWQCGALQPVFERITGRKAVNLEARSIRDLGALRRLRAVLSEFDPHIVHSFMPEMGCFSAAAFRGKKVFSVGNPVRYEPFMQKCWHTLSMNLSDAVIFNSRSTKELSSRYLLSKKREGMIYFPIESHAVSGPVNSERERLGIGSADKVLLSVSRISCRQKGHDILLRAFARVQRTVPATVLVLVGGADSPEDMACLRNIAREESIPENRVIFTGEATDTAPYFRTADVYVVSSR